MAQKLGDFMKSISSKKEKLSYIHHDILIVFI